MLQLALVFLGGGLGSLLRHGVALGVDAAHGQHDPERFPLATLLVNVIGCVLIGAASGWFGRREPLRLLLMVGLLGGFTTFSSFGLDTVRLFNAGQPAKAVWYVVLTNAAGLLGVWIAYELGAPEEPGLLDAD